MGARIFTATEKHAAAEREVKFRRHVYARRVEAKQMTQKLADEQIAVMEAIAKDYEALAAGERLI